MISLYLVITQVKYETKAFWRNPAAAFFTCAFPIMFLVIFNLLFGDGDLAVDGGTTNISTFYVPSIVAMSVISACYTSIAINICFSRERGVLKKIHGTPLPPWCFFLGKIGAMVLVSVFMVLLVTLLGAIFYDVDVPTNTIVAFLVTLVLGAATFGSLGIAISSIISNADAAPPVVNATVLPLLFISDVFIPMEDAPVWLRTFADIFPIKPFASALHTVFNPFETSLGFEYGHLGVMIVWLFVGLIVSARFFSWEPRS